MENLNILLCCGAGMSSGFLAQKARKAVKKKGLKVRIEAKSESEAAANLSSINILLLGPHYESHKDEFRKLAKPFDVPVEVIPQKIYGTLDGEKLLDFALEIIENKK
ncbi:PTS sugar transporter subunit IIB [Pullulanibacillus camelliae]|uniref:PTS sugar transporter subunit IIB n=1 Tax=Pullulanibacillus camelliae TaxID=1707096 RepID=A0A8J2YNL1_9BACL|nr:PTS sugar transporter subunit IIB [Pullulanibacillus camelliae]GGE54918.1 PTS sugar transporter subunit IIB [Pullulanibacillus camelliae]